MGIKGFTEYDAKDAELYNRMRWWLGLTWGDVLDKASDLYPSKVGLVDDDGRLTYQELRQKVDRLALGLIDLGIRPTDRVLIQIPNWCEYLLGLFRAGENRGDSRPAPATAQRDRNKLFIATYYRQSMDTTPQVSECGL